MTTSNRLAWLDALRGIGALAVVAEHLLPWVYPPLRPTFMNIGMYGVVVFFLVSGYIIPASLEGRGDVRAFWTSRLFRLYPLYLVVCAIALLVGLWVPIREQVPRDASGVLAHVSMLLDVVHVGGLADPMWTLSYEMVFYLVVTALFVKGVHRFSGWYAVAFGVLAVAAGIVIGAPWLPGPWPAVVSGVVFLVGMAGLFSGRFQTAAALVLGVMAVVLLIGSSYVPWFGAAILAMMFTGTAIHRWEKGAGPLWPVFAAAVLVALSPAWAIAAGWWWVQPPVWITTLVLAGATFWAGRALRHRTWPRVVVWLGLISYSVYLVHHPILRMVPVLFGHMMSKPVWERVLLAAGYLVALLLVSWATYRWVEAPAQRLGRRLVKKRQTSPAGWPPNGSSSSSSSWPSSSTPSSSLPSGAGGGAG
ncbi:acyltransferase family protein [Herbidospora cretacea]|uniref:acyltransferase family protein n=1 Tax=Herbidospora cretacea TaxID=28444 RepID=UPI0007C67152|nr:acyltransferase [Herbidospora cretacea]